MTVCSKHVVYFTFRILRMSGVNASALLTRTIQAIFTTKMSHRRTGECVWHMQNDNKSYWLKTCSVVIMDESPVVVPGQSRAFS